MSEREEIELRSEVERLTRERDEAWNNLHRLREESFTAERALDEARGRAAALEKVAEAVREALAYADMNDAEGALRAALAEVDAAPAPEATASPVRGVPEPKCAVCNHPARYHLDGVTECMESWGEPDECMCPVFIAPMARAPGEGDK
jgi:hypothetical protein